MHLQHINLYITVDMWCKHCTCLTSARTEQVIMLTLASNSKLSPTVLPAWLWPSILIAVCVCLLPCRRWEQPSGRHAHSVSHQHRRPLQGHVCLHWLHSSGTKRSTENHCEQTEQIWTDALSLIALKWQVTLCLCPANANAVWAQWGGNRGWDCLHLYQPRCEQEECPAHVWRYITLHTVYELHLSLSPWDCSHFFHKLNSLSAVVLSHWVDSFSGFRGELSACTILFDWSVIIGKTILLF